MTHRTSGPDPYLGAYAMAPKDPALAPAFWDAVAQLPVGGLEIPLPAEGAGPNPAWVAARPDLGLLVTCIPTVMARLGERGSYGLASTDDDARAMALADLRRARDLAEDHAASGAALVTAIEVQSAPGPQAGSRDALARSLEEALGWDLVGARLLLEHCDALVAGQRAAKGFLTLEDELDVLDQVGAHPSRPGLSINWGRSAIEGRGAGLALGHVRASADAGLLGALVLSGAAGVDTPWGAAWSDAHIPPRGPATALATSADSLLGPEEVAAALGAVPADCLVAVKVAVRPLDADVATRVAVARAALAMVAG